MNTMVALPILSSVPTMAPAMPGADPIFAAIQAHQKAYAAMQAVFSELERVTALADEEVGPHYITVPSVGEPGTTVEASCGWDIERAVPRKKYPELNAKYNRLLDERRAARAAIIDPLIGDDDEAVRIASEPEYDALDCFAETTPTTLQGLLAMVIYAGEIKDQNTDTFDRSSPIFCNMAAAAKMLVQRLNA